MKKIIMLCSVIVAGAAFVFAAEEEKNKEASTTEHHAMTPSDLKWGEMPPGLPSGAKMAVLNGDPTQAGAFTVRMRAPAGYTIAPHNHPTMERLTVISGAFLIGMGDKFNAAAMQKLGPGGYVALPSGMGHFAKTTSETIVQIDSEGPFQINYVNPADDPSAAQR